MIRPFPQPGPLAHYGYPACAGELIYAAMKVRMGVTNEIGISGVPAPAASYATIDSPLLAQLGNAAAGLLAALVVLIAIHLKVRGLPRLLIAAALAVASTLQLFGASILILRLTGIVVFTGTHVAGLVAWFWALFGAALALLYTLTTATYIRQQL